MNKVEFEDKKLKIDGKELELEFTINDARLINNLAIVIYKFDNSVPKNRQFQNCKAYDKDGMLVWTAEHPTNTTADSYVEFMNRNDNRIWNFGCFICEIDFDNGKLLSARFTK